MAVLCAIVACGGDDPAGPGNEGDNGEAGLVDAVGTRFRISETGTRIGFEETEYRSDGGEQEGSGSMGTTLLGQWFNIDTIMEDADVDSTVTRYWSEGGTLDLETITGTVDTTGSFPDWEDENTVDDYSVAPGDTVLIVLRRPGL